jgi:hypothetical protein
MFSIPKPATTENLLEQMKDTVESLKKADSIGAWFIKRRFIKICTAKKLYKFTKEQEERYALIVNDFTTFRYNNTTSIIVNDLSNPLLS